MNHCHLSVDVGLVVPSAGCLELIRFGEPDQVPPVTKFVVFEPSYALRAGYRQVLNTAENGLTFRMPNVSFPCENRTAFIEERSCLLEAKSHLGSLTDLRDICRRSTPTLRFSVIRGVFIPSREVPPSETHPSRRHLFRHLSRDAVYLSRSESSPNPTVSDTTIQQNVHHDSSEHVDDIMQRILSLG